MGMDAPRNLEGYVFPMSSAQQRTWILHRLDPTGASYNMTSAMQLEGPVCADTMEQVFNDLVDRHESLRTAFAEHDGQPCQVVLERLRIRLSREDLSQMPAASRRPRLREVLDQEAARRFELERGPLLHVRLLRLGAQEHVLVLNLHHIVGDAWSMGLLLQEMAHLYAAHQKGGEARLPALEIQYADHAVWQRDQLGSDLMRQQLAYWTRQLEGAPGMLELPLDRPRPAARSFAGAAVEFALGAGLTARIRQLAHERGATAFMVLCAVFNVLLFRYSGQRDLCLGTPCAGRRRAEVSGVVGLFVNTLVLRTRIDPDEGFERLLARVRETTLQAHAHQDLPFERLVEALNPERSLAHGPLVQAMFAFQNAFVGPSRIGDLVCAPLAVVPRTAKFDLSCTVWDADGELRGCMEYSTDLFDETSIRRLAVHFEALLAGACDCPATAVLDLPLLTDAERRRIVHDWNATHSPVAPQLLHQGFEERCRSHPQATALVFDGRPVSCDELNTQANRLAHHLLVLGVRPDSLVAVMLERGPELIVAILAVLKAGGAYVPVDPAYPRDRIAFMLDDSGPLALIATAASLKRLGDVPKGLALVDVQAPLPGSLPACNIPPQSLGLTPGHLAYVIYTSGSTGQPKGAMNEHRGIVNRLAWMQQQYPLAPVDAVLQKTPTGFDVSVWEIFWPLASGARMVLARPGAHRDPHELCELIQQQQVTTIHFVPSMLHAFLDGGALDRCASLRQIFCSGEALNASLVRRTTQALPQARLYNLYGPTEAAIDVAAWACDGTDVPDVVPIGRPTPNSRLYILDPRMQPVPVGATGELWIGGAQVGRGYLRRPQLTGERFVSDAFCVEPGALLYRTGDLARYRADGQIEFLGRMDHQVKLRGMRVELGEIESALEQQEDVAQAVVVATAQPQGDLRLVGYLVGRQPLDLGAVTRRLATVLPEHMIPAVLVQLARMPLTPNGKVDRHALPPPQPEPRRMVREAPRGEIECALAQMWRELLHVEEVDRSGHFFRLGGHSLTAMRLVSRVRQQLQRELPVTAVFEHPELQRLAQAILLAPVNRRVVMRRRTSGDSPVPLSFAQQRMWFLHRFAQSGALYNVPLALQLRGKLHPARLERALEALVCRHEPLRTVFSEHEGEPRQTVLDTLPLRMERIDLAHLPTDQAEAQLRSHMSRDGSAAFDLAQGPLMRAMLVTMDAERHVLLLVLHHIAADGWSLEILLRDLCEFYAAEAQSREPLLPELTFQFTDYAVWQREHLQGLAFDRSLAYWRQQLAGASPVLRLPSDRRRPVAPSNRGSRLAFKLSADLSARLHRLAAAHDASMFMVLAAALGALLCRYTRDGDLCIGTPVAGRAEAGLEHLVGLFVNTLVIRTRIDLDGSFEQLLAGVRETTLQAQAHAQIPFERLVEELNPPRNPGRTPLFQVMLSVQAEPDPTLRLDTLECEQMELDLETAKFDLTWAFRIAREELIGTVEYALDLFDEATARCLARSFEALIEAAAGAPATPVRQLPLLRPEERARLIRESSEIATVAGAPGCLHERFERQAQLRPQAVAVTFGQQALTYRQLDEQADRLAHRLRSLGVGPDILVGLCMHRSADLLVALLAILKAGGAYVPLDPAHPDERLAFVLNDACPAVVVTEKALASRVARHAPHLPCIDAAAPALDVPAPGRLPSLARGEHLAYVIYTSGSTGTPKGVMVEHRNLTRLFDATEAWFRFGPQDVWTLFHSVAFDFSVWEIWGAWLHGGRLVVVPQVVALDPHLFSGLIREHGVTVLNQTPSAFLQLTQAQREQPLKHDLRIIVLGGEAIDVSNLQPWMACERNRGLQLVNMYGITETAVHVTYRRLSADDICRASNSPIGVRIPDLRLYLLGEDDEPVPTGAAGELYVGGAGVARGYLNRPELTQERFLQDPFCGIDGQRMYRSGDLARRLPDGSLEYLGRSDRQIKIRGFRVEPGEVEAALRRIDCVRETVVTAGEDPHGAVRLVAYVVAGKSWDESMVRQTLRRLLPDHMVPSAFVRIEKLPLTANGKIDHRSLPDVPALSTPATGEVPRDGTETRLAQMWAELLDRPSIGRHEDFFDAGGHSLLAVKLAGLLRRAGLHVDVDEIFAHPTVASLAAHLDEGVRGHESAHCVRDGEGPPLFMTHEFFGSTAYVRRLARHLRPGFPVYVLPAPQRPGGESIEAMARRLADLVMKVQPHGPYCLAGWSFGGILAYQLAHELHHVRAKPVAFVGLLDTLAPELLCRRGVLNADIDRMAAVWDGPTADPADSPVSRAARHTDTLRCYRPPRAAWPVHLFRAKAVERDDPALGWEQVAGDRLRLHEQEGDHQGILDHPQVRSLADALGQMVEESVQRLAA